MDEEKHGFNLKLDKVTDLDDEPYSAANLLDPKDEFKLQLEWNLIDGHNYKNGDTITFDLPKGIKIQDEIKVELKDGNQTVANAVITTNNNNYITFTYYIDNKKK